VAERFGLPLPEEMAAAGRRSEPLADVSALAASYFQAELAAPGGARVRDYLRERGLTDETVRRFGLGFAPAGWDGLVRHLRARRVPVEHALEVGLLARREQDGSVYDRFRDRLMFPIHDRTGKVIAFGGRVLPGARPSSGDPPPKYLNSPESPLFHKGQTLYGLAQAREAIRKSGRVLVVEGYMDVIALSQAGIAEAVAPLGTALTVDQLRVLGRLSETVIACFDGDAAGRRAAGRSFPLFFEAGLWGRGAFLPSGEDPDSLVRTRGRDAVEECLAAAKPLIEAFVETVGGDQREAVGRRAAAAREVIKILKRVRVNHPMEYEVLERLAAESLGLRDETFRAETRPERAPAAAVPATPDRSRDAEEQLVEMMAADLRVADRVRAAGIIGEFQHPAWRQTAERLAGATAEADHEAAVSALPRELRDRIARRVLGQIEEEDRERAVADCIARIGQRRIARLTDEVRAAEARGDVAAIQAAWRQLQRLKGVVDHTEKART
jgi:DNA primase